MEAFACGEIGLTINKFHNLTPREFNNISAGYYSKQERLICERWEQSRLIAYYAAIGHLRKGTKPVQLMEFPWDENREEPLSLMEMEQIKKEVEKSKVFWEKRDRKHGKTNS